MKSDHQAPMLIIQGRCISLNHPTYFIADIAANHNGSLKQAKELIALAKKAGADAVKFQHFRAEKIVSRYGFESLSGQLSHQRKWKKSVFEIYQEASLPWEWTQELKQHCDQEGIHFLSAPYDLETIDMLEPYIAAYKIGSGDINWYESLERIAAKQKPVLLSTGASTIPEVKAAVHLIEKINPQLCVMQCNTNYTADPENFKHVNLNVLKEYARRFPDVVLGLSDHTIGHTTVLGAVALGARVIEKHFTSNRQQEGPDHAFSTEPNEWRDMVLKVREMECALGDGNKRIEQNELETVIVQRRGCRAARDLQLGTVLGRADIEPLRPASPNTISPNEAYRMVGKKINKFIPKGEAFQWEMFSE